MRSDIPAQTEVQSQSVIDAPVVLAVQRPGDVIPMTGRLYRVFLILRGIPEQVVGKVVAFASPRGSGVAAAELEITFCVREIILDLLVKRPAEAELELMGPPLQGNTTRHLYTL